MAPTSDPYPPPPPPTSDPTLPPPSHQPPITSFSSDSIIPLQLPISTKLTHSNFLAWQSQILPVVHGYNLYHFIDKQPPPQTLPSSTGVLSVNPAYHSWHRQDQLLLGWLRSSLTESILAQVVSCSTTSDLWISLTRMFSATSRARFTELRRKLQTFTKGSLSCSDYLQQIRKIADELAFIGSPISDDDLVLSAITGLGPEFNSFVVAVNTSNRQNPLTFADLHGLLLSHESLLISQTSTPSLPSLSSPSAYFTKPGN